MRLRTTLAAAGAAGLVTAATVAANAATPVTVSPSTDTAFSAVAGPLSASVPTTPFSCAQLDASGVILGGDTANNPGGDTHIADITDSYWQGCLTFLSFPLTVQQVGTWEVHIDRNESPTSGQTDVLSGSIENIEAWVYQTSSQGSCNFTVTGSAEGVFDEATQVLTIDESNSNLTVTAVTGCYGRILVNQNMNFQADLAIGELGNPNTAIPVNITP